MPLVYNYLLVQFSLDNLFHLIFSKRAMSQLLSSWWIDRMLIKHFQTSTSTVLDKASIMCWEDLQTQGICTLNL